MSDTSETQSHFCYAVGLYSLANTPSKVVDGDCNGRFSQPLVAFEVSATAASVSGIKRQADSWGKQLTVGFVTGQRRSATTPSRSAEVVGPSSVGSPSLWRQS